jgi:4-amino-4-deoxy-L-arabinose transferase-like glycosyltransferase
LLRLNKTEWLLLVLFLTLLVFPLQYISRSLDMSTLTSWRWVFTDKGPTNVFLLLLPALILAVPLSSSYLPEKHPAISLFLLSVLSCLPFINSPEYLLDSARYFLQAKYIAVYGISEFFHEWGGEISAWTDLPLVPLIYGFLFKLFGETKLVITFFNVLLFGFIPIITYLIGQLLWDRTTGFLAGVLIMASPYLPTQVPLMLVDIHVMFFLLLAVFAFLLALERGGFLVTIGSAIAIILALFSKYSTWPMLVVLGIIALIKLDTQPRRVIKRSFTVAVLTGLLLGIIFIWKGPLILEQINFLRTYQLSGLKNWQEGYVAVFFFQAHPYILLAALFGCCRAVINRDKKILIIVWFAALVFFLELKRLRYLLPLLPFLSLTAAYGLQAITHAQVRRYIVYCSVLSSLVVGIIIYRPFLAVTSMSNLKNAGSFLNTLQADAVEVYCLPQAYSLGNTSVAVPILDIYTDKEIYQNQTWNSDKDSRRAQSASLRFTWELTQPAYYRDKKYAGLQLPVVVISSEPISNMPEQLIKKYPSSKVIKKFTNSSRVFRFQTYVTVFETI